MLLNNKKRIVELIVLAMVFSAFTELRIGPVGVTELYICKILDVIPATIYHWFII